MSKPPTTIEEFIAALEVATVRPGAVPGTIIQRVLKPGDGWEWCIALGELMQPKREFRGGDLLTVAREAYAVLVEADLES